jgi:hypothetical protein
MSKFQLNHVTLVDKGAFGPWGYALLTPRQDFPEAKDADVIELRGLDRPALEAIAKALPVIKTESLALCFEAEVRTEVKDEVFVTKAGEPASKRVLRVYLSSTPVWTKEPASTGTGNLAEILGLNEGNKPPF